MTGPTGCKDSTRGDNPYTLEVLMRQTLTLPAGADGCYDIAQALAESCQVFKHLAGRGAVENAREGI